jgi:two-component system sensor histidine kinase/response regulator
MEKKGVSSNKQYKIGIVDDQIQIPVSLAELLEHYGFKTFHCFNGKDAIRISKEEKPDLLLLDIVMPEVGGFDVAKALPDQKVIFMTGYEVDLKKVKSFKNCVGFLKKPVTIEELLLTIKKVLKINSAKI